MKILFIFQGLPHYYNDILNRLNSLPGIQVTVLVPRNSGVSIGKGVFQTEEGVEFAVVRDDERKTFYGKPFFNNIKKIIKTESPDMIIAGWPYIQGFFLHYALYRFVKKNKIALVEKSIPYLIPTYQEAWKYYRMDTIPSDDDGLVQKKNNILLIIKHFVLTLFRRWYLPKLDAHVCYIEEAYEILESYGVPEKNIHIIYNSPDTDKIFKTKSEIESQPDILPLNNMRLIHVGRLVRWKKVHMLLNVVKKLSATFPTVELVVVGNGPEEDNLKKQAAELGIEHSVRFVGAVYAQQELGKYFIVSSIYVLAGVGGLSINEAMCYGKPIVCSECDGTEKKLVRDDVNGKYFINDDENDLFEKINYLLSNPLITEQMGNNSLKIIENELNVHTVVNRYQSVFHLHHPIQNDIH
jgi:glycosyltransferase involved in cell wall biosynthesis